MVSLILFIADIIVCVAWKSFLASAHSILFTASFTNLDFMALSSQLATILSKLAFSCVANVGLAKDISSNIFSHSVHHCAFVVACCGALLGSKNP
jgi:hypothetical protein